MHHGWSRRDRLPFHVLRRRGERQATICEGALGRGAVTDRGPLVLKRCPLRKVVPPESFSGERRRSSHVAVGIQRNQDRCYCAICVLDVAEVFTCERTLEVLSKIANAMHQIVTCRINRSERDSQFFGHRSAFVPRTTAKRRSAMLAGTRTIAFCGCRKCATRKRPPLISLVTVRSWMAFPIASFRRCNRWNRSSGG